MQARPHFTSLVAICVALSANSAAAGERSEIPRLIIFELTFTADLDEQTQALYADLLHEKINDVGIVEVLGSRDLASMVKASGEISRATSCVDDDCMLQIGTLIDVRFLMTGSLAVYYDDIVLSVRILDRKTRTVPARATQILGSRLPEIERNMARLADDIIGQLELLLPPKAPEPNPIGQMIDRLDTTGVVGLTIAGAGVASLLAGAVVGLKARSKDSEVGSLDDDTPTNQAAAASARTLGWVANGLWLGGGLAIALGGVLSYIGFRPLEAQLEIQPTPTGVSVAVSIGGGF